jgi:monoterpene epsilon-lactone hydrolase
MTPRAWPHARGRAAEVDVILDITADVRHVFQAFTGVLDEADQALDRAALFLTQHVQPATSAS